MHTARGNRITPEDASTLRPQPDPVTDLLPALPPCRFEFPDPRLADGEYGLVGLGADHEPETLLAAYRSGIFPWPHQALRMAWFCPPQRMVLRPEAFRIHRSLRKTLKHRRFRLTVDTDFEAVLLGCATTPRDGQPGTWLVPSLRAGLMGLHQHGVAHSVEVWDRQDLVGGLYGIALGRIFTGESMFSRGTDASKIALLALCAQLHRWGFHWVDCQVHTDHLASLGAYEIPRDHWLDEVQLHAVPPDRMGPWSFDHEPYDLIEALRIRQYTGVVE